MCWYTIIYVHFHDTAAKSRLISSHPRPHVLHMTQNCAFLSPIQQYPHPVLPAVPGCRRDVPPACCGVYLSSTRYVHVHADTFPSQTADSLGDPTSFATANIFRALQPGSKHRLPLCSSTHSWHRVVCPPLPSPVLLRLPFQRLLRQL